MSWVLGGVPYLLAGAQVDEAVLLVEVREGEFLGNRLGRGIWDDFVDVFWGRLGRHLCWNWGCMQRVEASSDMVMYVHMYMWWGETWELEGSILTHFPFPSLSRFKCIHARAASETSQYSGTGRENAAVMAMVVAPA